MCSCSQRRHQQQGQDATIPVEKIVASLADVADALHGFAQACYTLELGVVCQGAVGKDLIQRLELSREAPEANTRPKDGPTMGSAHAPNRSLR